MSDALGLPWDALVSTHVEAHGGWTALADELARRVRLAGGEPPNLDAAQKGLRRLAGRKNEAGGQYGRWLLKHFGVPAATEDKLAWLVQYHGRFADLPTSVRREHLRLWDRPPISESRAIAWVHIGLASVHHRRQEVDLARERLRQARRLEAGPLAFMEGTLLAARLASDREKIAATHQLLDSVEATLDHEDRAHIPYHARLVGQRAFRLTRDETVATRYEDARALFTSITPNSGHPFVDYRRTAGLAYCAFRLGEPAQAASLAREAAEHAGDGGYVRFRVMALNLLARIVGGEEARAHRARAARLARAIEDFHLEEVARIHE